MRDWMVQRVIYAQEKGNKYKCATCKYDLEDINRSNNNCLIVLEEIIFNMFSDYMPTKNSNNYRRYIYDTRYYGVQNDLTHLYPMSGKTVDRSLKK